VKLTLSGDGPEISQFAALEYAANLDSLIYHSAIDGPRVHSLAAPAGSSWPELVSGKWRWRRLVNDETCLDPIADAAAISSYAVNRNHIFGRFRIATFGHITVAILVRHTDTPVYAIKLE
jgi:hypothetical protein